MWLIQFPCSPSNPVGMEKWQELLLPCQWALAAIEVQHLPPSYSPQMHRLGGAEKANCPANLLSVKMLCAPSVQPVQTLWHRGAASEGSRRTGVHWPPAEGRKTQGKVEVLPGAPAWSGKGNELICSNS